MIHARIRTTATEILIEMIQGCLSSGIATEARDAMSRPITLQILLLILVKNIEINIRHDVEANFNGQTNAKYINEVDL